MVKLEELIGKEWLHTMTFGYKRWTVMFYIDDNYRDSSHSTDFILLKIKLVKLH